LVRCEELNRFIPATARVAREAYRRIMGQPKHIGVVFQARKNVSRARVIDKLGLNPKPLAGPVVPKEEDMEEGIAGMDLPDTGA
jgi:hypothetical protein